MIELTLPYPPIAVTSISLLIKLRYGVKHKTPAGYMEVTHANNT